MSAEEQLMASKPSSENGDDTGSGVDVSASQDASNQSDNTIPCAQNYAGAARTGIRELRPQQ